MTHVLSVTEIRNALRCPRVFALGRQRGQQVAFPVGASSLGSAFHRIVETFGRNVCEPPASIRALDASAGPDVVSAELSAWLVEFLVRELELNPSYASMPAEVDDLSEALRQFAAYVARACARPAVRPAEALSAFLAGTELSIETLIELGGEVAARVSGRIDALHAPPDRAVEVVEYKLTEDSNEEIDRAQVALYRHLLTRSQNLDAAPVILRFNPGLTTTRLAPETADALVDKRLLPLIGAMVEWIEHPEAAPSTGRTDLCPACPVRRACAEAYGDRLPIRDDPPAGAARPRPEPSGEVQASSAAQAPAAPPAQQVSDEDGRRQAEELRDRILAILKRQGVAAAAPKAPVVSSRLIRIEVSAPRGSVTKIDRAAEDVRHQLHAEQGIVASYTKEGGLRLFSVVRTEPRVVPSLGLLDSKATWLAARPGRFVLGEALDGSTLVGDLSEPACCHLLVGGLTGSGKSVLLRSIAASLAHYHPPSAIRFTLVDPKRVSFAKLVTGLGAHLAGPLCHDAEEALPVLEDLVEDMEDRYRLFAEEKVQDVDELNESKSESERLARHVVMVDEFQDLIVSKDTRESFIAVVRRLGAKARAAGIHLILATQRPTKENLPTSIKANLPGKVALRVSAALESRIILDASGAEALLGRGDLLADLGSGVVRAQAPFDG